MTILDPGLSSVLQQRVAASYGAGDTEAISSWIATGLWITAGVAIVIMVSGMVCSRFLVPWMNLSSAVDGAALASAFRWSVVGSALMFLSFSVTAANQGLQSSLGIGIIFVAVSVVRLALVIGLARFRFGLLAIAVPSVVMGFLLLLGNLVYLRARLGREGIRWSWAPTRFRELAGLLSFTSLSRIASIFANNVDLFLVARLLGPDSVNVLRFTRTAPEMSRMLVERPFVAVQPSLAHLLGASGVDRAREILVRMVIVVICLAALLAGGFLVFNHHFVRLWVGNRFYAGTGINVLLTAGCLAAAGTSVLSGLCFAAGNIRGNSLAGLAQALLYLPLLWAGGHWFGMRGVVAASLSSVVLTQGWYMPSVFYQIYRLAKNDRARILKIIVLAGFSATVSAAFYRNVNPQAWIPLAGWAVVFSISYGSLLLLLSSEARSEMRNGWDWCSVRLLRAMAGRTL
jgi:O-antigen/teichoic acid export membrane protein